VPGEEKENLKDCNDGDDGDDNDSDAMADADASENEAPQSHGIYYNPLL